MSHTVSTQEISGSGGQLSVDFLDTADGGLPTAERSRRKELKHNSM
jgi:hypothetical protein